MGILGSFRGECQSPLTARNSFLQPVVMGLKLAYAHHCLRVEATANTLIAGALLEVIWSRAYTFRGIPL